MVHTHVELFLLYAVYVAYVCMYRWLRFYAIVVNVVTLGVFFCQHILATVMNVLSLGYLLATVVCECN